MAPTIQRKPTPTRYGPVLLILSVGFAAALSPSGAFGLEATDVGSGQVSGTVRITGTPVPPKRFNLVLNPDPYFCGRISDGKGWRLSPMTPVGPHRVLQGAVAYLKDAGNASPSEGSLHLMTIRDCVIRPYVEPLQTGDTLQIENWDPVHHQIEVFMKTTEGGVRLLSTDLPPHPDNRKSEYLSEGQQGTPRQGGTHLFHLDQPGILFFRCNFHEYMEGWRVVLPHSYYDMTQERGQFTISHVPAGTYRLKIWHPLGSLARDIRVQADESLSLDLPLIPDAVLTYQDSSINVPIMEIDLVGDEHIVPSVELQTWAPYPTAHPKPMKEP